MEVEEGTQLQKERALLLGELSTLRAKFELTLQTLRSLLGLQLSCSWADIVEHVELLTRLADGRKTKEAKEPSDAEEREVEELQQLLLNAEMDLDEKERQLEEQQNRVQSLSNVLAKQQNVLDMTAAQISNQQEQKDLVAKQSEQLMSLTLERDRLRDERDRLWQEANHLRELNHVQQRSLQEKESQLSSAEASLATNQQALLKREQELCALQADHQRQQVEIEELCEAVAWREGEVDRIRSQLDIYEAAERRKHSYRSGSSSFLGRVASARSLDGSEPGSSLSSAQPSARGERRNESSVPSTPGAGIHGAVSPASSRRALRPVAPLASMDKEERAAFLSHFPMASRTERHLRHRINDSNHRY
ncbi:unnamed protein product [Cladocopium goreaui]|uniref:Cilia- and flagella-associated protein 157 n=1 Tax=Cladocopium goreaui TaxID=2562237 RepID=A0A9P1FH53_9DINO|nr:unnamed protein product [Cladocopium goreaui]